MMHPVFYVFRALLPLLLGFALMCSYLALTGQVKAAQPSEQYLRHKYGHRTVASATCRDVVEAVNTWGLQVAEQTALAYGMTPRQRIRAYSCLRRFGIAHQHGT